jgi:hypothetical protein
MQITINFVGETREQIYGDFDSFEESAEWIKEQTGDDFARIYIYNEIEKVHYFYYLIYGCFYTPISVKQLVKFIDGEPS